MAKGKLEAAKAGETVTFVFKKGKKSETGTEVVKEPCDDKNNGYWYCLTHQEGFQNNLQKDIHIDEHPDHKFVWMCWKHGAEQP